MIPQSLSCPWWQSVNIPHVFILIRSLLISFSSLLLRRGNENVAGWAPGTSRGQPTTNAMKDITNKALMGHSIQGIQIWLRFSFTRALIFNLLNFTFSHHQQPLTFFCLILLAKIESSVFFLSKKYSKSVLYSDFKALSELEPLW